MFRNTTYSITCLLVSVVLLLSACTSPAPTATLTPTASAEQPLTPVTLSLGFIPSVQFAPFYVAIDKGFFADEQIEIELENGMETDFMKLVGANERSFIVASGEQVILARAQNLPVTYVAAWYRKFPVVVFTRAASGIQTPQDLIGKKVGLPGLFGASLVAWKGLSYANQLPEEQISLESIGFTQAAAVRQGLVDAALDYAVNGPVQLRLAGEEVNVIAVDDYLRLPSNGLVTNETVMAQQPALVQSMVRAMLRGIRYTLENPDEAFAISLKFVPEAAQQREVNRAIFDASLTFWQPGEGERLGFSDPAIWPATAQFMADAGLVDKVIATDDIWTNRFVEAIETP